MENTKLSRGTAAEHRAAARLGEAVAVVGRGVEQGDARVIGGRHRLQRGGFVQALVEVAQRGGSKAHRAELEDRPLVSNKVCFTALISPSRLAAQVFQRPRAFSAAARPRVLAGADESGASPATSGRRLVASSLPSSTPHWSKALMS